MSMPSSDPNEPGPDATGPSGSGWTLIALLADPGAEPPAGLSDRDALATWCAVSTLWHPSLLARSDTLPRMEEVDSPSPPGPREVRVLAAGMAERLPSGYRTQAEDAGAILLEARG